MNGTTETAKEVAEYELKSTESWSHTFEQLPKYDKSGNAIQYTVVEKDLPEGYISEVTGTMASGFTVTNTLTRDITVTKTWGDANGADGVRTSKVEVAVMNGTTEIATYEVKASELWTHTFTDLPKYTATGAEINYTVVEKDVPEGYISEVTGTMASGFTVTNTLTRDITVTKIWEDFEVNTRKPINVSVVVGEGENEDIITSATITAQEVSETDNNKWIHTFTDLPKYDTNGVEIAYKVKETTVEGYTIKEITGDASNGFNITNTYNNVTINKMVYKSETKSKVDVMFVLDISGSMVQNKVSDGNNNQITRAKAMVNATNQAITEIMNKNSENRVGVVMFSTTATEVLDLQHYSAKNNTTINGTKVGEFFKYSESTDWWENNTTAKITTNITGKTDSEQKVTGGTYTQSGIALGADILANSSDATGRTPVIILLTDGEPTWGYSEYNSVVTRKGNNVTVNSYNIGSGSSSNESGEIGYLTILTANHYKNEVNNHYKTEKTPSIAKMYTIGIGMSGAFNEAVLRPNSDRVAKCKNSNLNGAKDLYNYLTGATTIIKYNTKYDWWGSLTSYDTKTLANPYTNYDYADGSWSGNIDAKTLAEILGSIVNYEPEPVGTTTNINRDVVKVELTNIDINKNIIIKLDGVETTAGGSTVASLIESGVVEGPNENGKYYINLKATMFDDAKLIDITYYEVKANS